MASWFHLPPPSARVLNGWLGEEGEASPSLVLCPCLILHPPPHPHPKCSTWRVSSVSLPSWQQPEEALPAPCRLLPAGGSTEAQNRHALTPDCSEPSWVSAGTTRSCFIFKASDLRFIGGFALQARFCPQAPAPGSSGFITWTPPRRQRSAYGE